MRLHKIFKNYGRGCTTIILLLCVQLSTKYIEGVVRLFLGVYVDLDDPTNGQDTPPFLQTILAVGVNWIGKFRKCWRPATMATDGHVTSGLILLLVVVGKVSTRMRAVGRG